MARNSSLVRLAASARARALLCFAGRLRELVPFQLGRATQPAFSEVKATARGELLRRERLDEIVVGAGGDPLHARLLTGARRQHDHRNARVR
jgi:hypothetical protein